MHGDQPTSVLEALLERRETIEKDIKRLDKQLSAVAERVRALRIQHMLVLNEIHAVEIGDRSLSLPCNGKINSRSTATLRVWAALHRALGQRNPAFGGLTHAEASKIIYHAMPGCKDATIRSYLHRLKIRGLIESRSGTWQLTQPRGDS